MQSIQTNDNPLCLPIWALDIHRIQSSCSEIFTPGSRIYVTTLLCIRFLVFIDVRRILQKHHITGNSLKQSAPCLRNTIHSFRFYNETWSGQYWQSNEKGNEQLLWIEDLEVPLQWPPSHLSPKLIIFTGRKRNVRCDCTEDNPSLCLQCIERGSYFIKQEQVTLVIAIDKSRIGARSTVASRTSEREGWENRWTVRQVGFLSLSDS